MPAATRAAALTGRILPSCTPIVVMTTIMGKPVAENSANGSSWCLGRSRGWSNSAGVPRTTRAAARAAAQATTTNTSSRTAVVSGLRRSRNTATATIGANSPTLPIAMTRAPKRPSNRPASLSIGSSVPRAVVVRARLITMASMTVPIAVSAEAINRARASEIIHPVVASFKERPRMRGRSSSTPARNIRYDSPRSSKATMTLSGWATPRTAGPITMPKAISKTTPGMARRPGPYESSVARTGAAVPRETP